MRATRAYHDATARVITPKITDWLNDLAQRFGEERVAAKIAAKAAAGTDPARLLTAVRDELAKEDATRRQGAAPVELAKGELLAIARGELAAPPTAYTYETRDLSYDEYSEVLAWRARARGVVPDRRPAEQLEAMS